MFFKKKVTLHVGVADDLQPVTRKIPSHAPKPWDGKDQLKHVGNKVTRVDGPEKVSGEAKYTFDAQPSGMLYGRFIVSPHPHAKVYQVDTSKAEKYPGVRAVHVIPKKFPFTVRYVGQEIAAVAADTPQQALEASKLIELDIKALPFVTDMEKAKEDFAPVVFQTKESNTNQHSDTQGAEEAAGGGGEQKGNIRGPRVHPQGADKEVINSALEKSDVKVKSTYSTQVQTHSALEPHGLVAKWISKKELQVWVSTQGTFSVRDDLAAALGLSKSNVHVNCEYVGGGFGAKFGAGIYGITAAHLAKKSNAPVRMIYDRREEHISGGNRPNSVQTLEIGANNNGEIQAIKMECYATSGIGTGGATMVSGPARNIYQSPHSYAEETDVYTNAGPGTFFRAPGHPQGAFALEQTIDELAEKLGMDPLEFRKRNTKHHLARQKEYEIGAKMIGWDNRNKNAGSDKGIIRRGVGVANSVWYYFHGTGFQATLEVHSDGSVEITNGVQDIGTGIRTVLATIVAEELELDPHQIKVNIGDSKFGFGPPSGGSQTTAGISPAVRNAAYAAKQKMIALAAKLLKVKPKAISFQDGKFFVTANPEQSKTWKQVAARINGDKFMVVGERKKDHIAIDPFKQETTIAGVQFAQIAVDTETGVISVEKIVAVHDCGRAMNRLTLESQINGGIIQGVSYALFEDRIMDHGSGHMLNANFDQYRIAGSMDTPQIESVVIDVHHGQSSTGAAGIGEPATVPTAAAIANAFYHATGVRVRSLPLTPAKVLAALQSK